MKKNYESDKPKDLHEKEDCEFGDEKSSDSNPKKEIIRLTDRQKKKIRVIRKLSRLLDYVVLAISLFALFIGVYAFWDTHQVMEIASTQEYSVYKPDSKENLSFESLKKINPEVYGWIDIYGTNIDYPIVQGKDNWEYLNKTVLGEFSTGGSIFLDYRNEADFSDFQNIIYGHYMAKRKMFGDIELFKDESFFDNHRYGVIHRNGKPSRGIEFFAYVKTVGSDQDLLSPSKSLKDKSNLMDHIYKEATYLRKVDLNKNENLVVLDTCDLSVTNGRYILVGKLSDRIEKNNFVKKKVQKDYSNFFKKTYKVDMLILLLILWILLVLIYLIYKLMKKNKERGEAKKDVQDNQKQI